MNEMNRNEKRNAGSSIKQDTKTTDRRLAEPRLERTAVYRSVWECVGMCVGMYRSVGDVRGEVHGILCDT